MLNYNEIYDNGGVSTIIFKEHLILRKGINIDSIIDNVKEKLQEYTITKMNRKEIFVEPLKGTITKKEIENVKNTISNLFKESCRMELLMNFIPYEKGLIVNIK